MQRYVALLRGINVGGHRVKMADLRTMFAALGLCAVQTFIASGNVIFETDLADTVALQATIERHLRQQLGYEAATFLRSPQELAAIAAFQPFPASEIEVAGHTLSIMFLAAPPPTDVAETYRSLRTDMDQFHVHDREIYWLCRGKTSDSLVDWPRLGKTAPILSTTRNATTVRKLAAVVAE